MTQPAESADLIAMNLTPTLTSHETRPWPNYADGPRLEPELRALSNLPDHFSELDQSLPVAVRDADEDEEDRDDPHEDEEDDDGYDDGDDPFEEEDDDDDDVDEGYFGGNDDDDD